MVHGFRSPGAREAGNQPWESARLRETRPTTSYCPGGGRRVRPDRRTPTQVPTGPARYQPQTVWVYLVRKRWTYPPTGREIAQIIADASTNSPHANATSCGYCPSETCEIPELGHSLSRAVIDGVRRPGMIAIVSLRRLPLIFRQVLGVVLLIGGTCGLQRARGVPAG